MWAGGSGLNVVVVVNQNSANSVELGNYYCEKRQVPPQNLLRINWNGQIVAWNDSDFNTYLLNPLLSMVSSRQLTNQIDYVVLSMDIPYRVFQTGDVTTSGANSTTAVVYYGFKPDGPGTVSGYASCNLPDASSNSYASSEDIFRTSPPLGAPTNSFLTMMITSTTLAQAKAVIDHGVLSDATFPAQPVVLAKSYDIFRNVRFVSFDNPIFNTRVTGGYNLTRTISDSPYGLTNLLGYETGLARFSILPNAFVPGAFADSLTSLAGMIFEPNDQTNLLAFLTAGATGSYGTVLEPCNYLEKFPSPQTYFYQSRGFSLAECCYQGVTNPFQGLLVGEPLAAPFERRGTGSWLNLTTNALLTGLTNLSLAMEASDPTHPLEQVDLFVDGQWWRTATNLPPAPGNLLDVTINGHTMGYQVPVGASIKDVASGITTLINKPANTNATKVLAFAYGDRIELQSIDRTKLGEQVPVSVSNSLGSATALTTSISASLPEFLDTVAFGLGSFLVLGSPDTTTLLTTNSFLQCVVTKVNSSRVTIGVTNTTGTLTVTDMGTQLFNLINANVALQGQDGVTAQDFVINYTPPPDAFQFNLVPNTVGWNAAQIRVALTGSPEFRIQGSLSGRLDDNLSDLRPRNHLYVTAGVTNLVLTFGLDTTLLANGYHSLSAVAYEGTHIHTQTPLSQTVQVQNDSLSAAFALNNTGTNIDLGGVLQFTVVANTNNVSSIQLFSTGGLINSVLNQTSASFSVAAASLGAGLHPFYALVTTSAGTQYRTQTIWARIANPAPPFPLTLTAPPATLSWPAVAGQNYDVLTTTDLSVPFQLAATFTASNSPATWTDPNPVSSQRFYRVQTSN